ncbi:hypothetical protein PpBr36_03240 [Pyricularia pennisetigena]|uniref:hypothetical protein n=1 Tax=Pyricularia pennisetigena TaxID=1578925 RepID=UPI0011510C53|nr:hypothetical protein PpBr36_03240 [Pyricularia pennisetigena]TLS31112.1 hypothetical protein PpBr36_03240 [Pyricularia pennisetigena]
MSTAIPVPSSPCFGPGQSLVFNPLPLGHYQPHDQRHNQHHQPSAEPTQHQKPAARPSPPQQQQCSSGSAESCPQNKKKTKASSSGKRAQELVPPPRLEIRGKDVDDKALISPLMLSESPRTATAVGGAAGGGHG